MNRKICCFAGHGKISYGKDIQNRLSDKCRELITDYGVNEFWTGNYGAIIVSFVRLNRALAKCRLLVL